MADSVSSTSHLSITFTTEEVRVLAAELGYDPQQTGVAPPIESTRREREIALAAAARSLRSRRVITGTDGDWQIAEPVAALVDIVCRPLARLALYGPVRVRYLIRADASIRVEQRDGLHRFMPFATADLLRRVMADAGLAPDQRPGRGEPIDLPAGAYARLRRTLHDGSRQQDTASMAMVSDAGIPDGILHALASRAERSLSVRRRVGGRIIGVELTWVDAGEDGLWELPAIDQPMAGGDSSERLGDELTVRMAPTSPQVIATAITGCLRGLD